MIFQILCARCQRIQMQHKANVATEGDLLLERSWMRYEMDQRAKSAYSVCPRCFNNRFVLHEEEEPAPGPVAGIG